MAAAALAVQQRRLNIKKIEQPDAVRQYAARIDLQMILEKYVKIRGAPAEKQNLGGPIDFQIIREPLP